MALIKMKLSRGFYTPE